MILALLLAVETPAMTAIEAERAFVADAQKLGQWTAFRKYAADDAVLFVPEQVNAQAFLKDKKDPPVSVYWWPGKSFVSCDGSYAVNTGPWVRQYGKSVGYFTTVWKRQPDGSWKWIYDGGDSLEVARAEGGDIKPQQASCENRQRVTDPAIAKAPFSDETGPGTRAYGRSVDGTLFYSWGVKPDGSRDFVAYLWNGKSYDAVIDDVVARPK